jgi:branched-chain amino acid transport system ATP-binding protein
VLGLIGPNGAGKTTLVNVLSGFQRPATGSVRLAGTHTTGWNAERLASEGLTRTFQNARLFQNLTVFENIEAGAVGVGRGRREARQSAEELLDRLHLRTKAFARASSLSHGDERRLGIARALATRPRFLLLDEPAAGLNEAESDELVQVLIAIREEFPLGVLVIEHDMRVIMRLCQRIQVLDYGKTIAIGPPDEIKRNPAVLEAYLGAEES